MRRAGDRANRFVNAVGTASSAYNLAKKAYRAGTYAKARLLGKKRRPTRPLKLKRLVKTKASVKSLAKDVNRLKKNASTLKTVYIRKYRSFASVKPATNQAAYSALSLNSRSSVEQSIDSLKYFNPSAPSTLINVDCTAPTFQQRVRFTKNYLSALVRNNYSVPCAVDFYFLKSKKDTSIDPDTAMSNSLADMSNASLTASQVYPSDCHDFNDLWKIVKHTRRIMQAGDQLEFTGAVPAFDYDVSLSDSETAQYLRYLHGSAIMIRVEGILGHGSTSGVGCMQAGVDIEWRRNHTVEYSGGVNTTYLEIEENTQAISGTHQCSQLYNEQAVYSL